MFISGDARRCVHLRTIAGFHAPCHDRRNEDRKGPWRLHMLRLTLALVLSLGAAASASAQGWPDKPIRMIVPLPAGAAVDVVGRLICSKLGERLGQTIVVEN